MTTIAFKDSFVAADTALSLSSERRYSSVQKLIWRDDILFAYGGVWALHDAWIKWYLNGADPASYPTCKDQDEGCSQFLVFRDGAVYDFSSNRPYPQTVIGPYAIGTGREYALGAMAHGASAGEAVKAAMVWDVYTGGEVQVSHIRQPGVVVRAAA
jgi:hypothetical protein